MTFCSGDIDHPQIQLYFAYSDINSSDTLYIHDGPSTASPLIGAYNNTTNPNLNLWPVEASIYNVSGCLTVHFVSNAHQEGTGWSGIISCESVCQEVIATLSATMTSPSPVDGYIGICPGDEITFSAYAEYSQNDLIYHQSDATSLFFWDFGDGTTATGPTVNHTYGSYGGYTVNLTVTDINECVSTNSIETRVVIAGSPYAGLSAPPDICINDTLEMLFTLEGNPGAIIDGDPYDIDISTTLGVSDTTYLPDGTGVCYETSVNFSCFDPGQTLMNAWDILNICATMEHSFLGDLQISIICPNGQSIILKEFTDEFGSTGQGGGTYLGEPIDMDDGVPGVGYEYCWSPTPTFGTMVDESGVVALPAGSYGVYESFAGLVGCPLNGTWTIEVCDNWAIDDGFVFGWYIELNPDIAPNSWSYEVGIDHMGWTDGPYIISENDSSIFVNPSASGTFYYTYTIVDDFGCEWDTIAPLTVLPTPDVDLGADLTFCDNTTSYLIDAGAHPGCTFHWHNGSAAQTFNAVASGAYSVTISNGICDDIDTLNIVFSGLSFDYTSTDVSCYGGSNGSIDITVSSLYPPYSYEWSNGSVLQDLNSIPAANYTVTVTDDGGCVIVETIAVAQPSQINLNLIPTAVSCNGGNNGAIDLVANGGVPGYTYSWDNSAVTEDISALIADDYTVTVTDLNGCTSSESATVTQPALLTASIVSTDIVCFGDVNGEADLTVTGGIMAYTYHWSNGAVTQDLTGLTGGNYNVTVTDFNGCTATASTTINTVSEPLANTLIPSELLCYGDQNGTIMNTVTGGTPPYSYLWSNGMSTEDLSNLTAGTYTVTILDHNGCVLTSSAEVTQPGQLFLTLTGDHTICIDASTNLSASATGGTFPYNYSWSNGGITSSITVSPDIETIYTVTITDLHGCTLNKSVTISLYDSLHLEISLADDQICAGEPAVINGSVNGGNGGPYELTVNGMLTAIPFTTYPASNQAFEVCVNDMCTTPEVCKTINVIVMPLPTVTFMADDVSGCQPHTVNFNSWGDGDIIQFDWNFGDVNSYNTSGLQNPQHVYEAAGLYTVSLTVTDTGGCKSTVTQENMIEVYPLPQALFTPEPSRTSIVNPIIYFSNNSINADVSRWNFGDGDSSEIFSPQHEYPNEPNTYTVILEVISEHGCKDTAQATVYIEDEYTFYAPSAFSPNDDDINDLFYFRGEGIVPETFSFYIYDRWGEVIYYTNEYIPETPESTGWDGRVKERKKAPTGVYTWLVKYTDESGNNHEKAGSVTLIR